MDCGDAAGPSRIGGGPGQAAVKLAIFDAWSDEAWVNEGAAVRVSLVCFALRDKGLPVALDGKPVDEIYADLTANQDGGNLDLTRAQPLLENTGVAFQGPTKGGSFDIAGDLARQWLKLPNPNGLSNSQVVKPWVNGKAITNRWADNWIIDFAESTENQASLFEAPFEHVLKYVKPEKQTSARERRRRLWWQFNEVAPGLRIALQEISHYITTPEVSKHRLFVWLPVAMASDKNLVVIARDNQTTFGVLHSRFHKLWALRMGTSLEDRPRYRCRN